MSASARVSTKQVERISARQYYGEHRTGTVILVDGQPSHFTGESASRDAAAFQRRMQRFDFQYEFEKAIKGMGATPHPNQNRIRQSWLLETPAGLLEITPITDDLDGKPYPSGHGWVAMCFEDVKKAGQLLAGQPGFNPHSGKWNFHPADSDPDPVRGFLEKIQREFPNIAAPCAQPDEQDQATAEPMAPK